MIKTLAIGAAFVLALAPVSAMAAGGAGHVEDYDFAFEQSYSDYDQTSPDTSFTFQVNLAGIGNTGKGRTRPVRLGCRG